MYILFINFFIIGEIMKFIIKGNIDNGKLFTIF